MPNKRIYIISDYRVGAADGLAEFNYQNVNLLKNDFDFHFIEFDKHEPISFHETLLTDGFKIFRFGIKDLGMMQLPKPFLNWIKSVEKTDALFHLHHIFNLRNYLISRRLVKFDFPYLITPHDSFVYAPEYRKQRPFIKRLYRDAFVQIFDKYVLDHALLVHALTEQCLECLKYVTKTPVMVVLNQVDDMRIEFNPANIKSQVCFIGRFDIFRKGIDLALTGYQIFKNNLKIQADTSFILIGPASKEAEEQSHQICKDLNLENGKDVIFTGKIPVEDRNKILSESKVYMQLSRTEGFGLSIAQALSCCKPVIVSKQVPIHDIISTYKGGISVDSPEEAAKALALIFNLSEDDYQKMALNARRCYETEFHPTVIKPQLISMYEKTFQLATNISTKSASIEEVLSLKNI